MKKTNLDIVYQGTEYEDGMMDVIDFAPSLLAFGELMEEANFVINKDRAKIHTRISADFKHNCFKIHLELSASLIDKSLSLFGLDSLSDISDLLNLIGIIQQHPEISTGVIISYFGYKYWAKNRIPKNVKKLENGNIEISFEDETREVSIKVWLLEINRKFRKRIAKHIIPKGPIKYVSRQEDGKLNEVEIEEDKKDSLKYIDYEEPATENIITQTLELVTSSYDEKYMWRFFDGEKIFQAPIEDDKFWRDYVNSGAKFGKGDIFKVNTVERQDRDEEGNLKKHHIVKEVIEFNNIPTLFNDSNEQSNLLKNSNNDKKSEENKNE